MRTAKDAQKDGMTIDVTTYPWVAYAGDRFAPTKIERVMTNLESDLLEACKDALELLEYLAHKGIVEDAGNEFLRKEIAKAEGA